jgi:hypothetical protein
VGVPKNALPLEVSQSDPLEVGVEAFRIASKVLKEADGRG